MNIFLGIETIEGVGTNKPQVVISVRVSDKKQFFPLTKRGCLHVGRYLAEIGAEDWMHSSSLDYPKEYKKGFRYDVHELIAEGYKSRRPQIYEDTIGKYKVWGNEYAALAINVLEPTDFQDFVRSNASAFETAIEWAKTIQ